MNMDIKKCANILLFVMLFIRAINICAVGDSDKSKTVSGSNSPDNTLNDIKTGLTDPKKPIIVTKSKPEFSIILLSSPGSTGYSWLLKEYNANLISPVSYKFYIRYKKLIGAPGYEKWTFRIKSFVVPQVTNISFVYARPWTKEDFDEANFRIITTSH